MAAPRALSASSDDVVVLGRTLASEVLAASRASDRRRMIYPFHKHDGELVHRMFNALQPGTYVAPHRHVAPPKNESFLVLAGIIDFVIFDQGGEILRALRLQAGGEQYGVDLAAGIFHTFVVRAPDTLLYEVKLGPYSPSDDKDFARWAPREGEPGVSAYQSDLVRRLTGLGLQD